MNPAQRPSLISWRIYMARVAPPSHIHFDRRKHTSLRTIHRAHAVSNVHLTSRSMLTQICQSVLGLQLKKCQRGLIPTRARHHPCSRSRQTVSQSAEEETGDLNAEVDQPSGLNVSDRPPRRLAIRNAPLIRGLFLPSLQLPRELAEEVLQKCMQTYFVDASNAGNGVNQVMLFGRAVAGESSSTNNTTGLPPILNTLLESLSHLLRSHLPRQTHDLLFRSDQSYSNGTRGTGARQAILNLYKPGEGITPHVDLVGRFGDGIMGVSLGGGCVMNFERQRGTGQYRGLEEGGKKRWDVYLPERSILVLSEEARYGWTHGIEKLYEDWVEVDPACNGQYYRDIANDVERDGEWVPRGVRLSITFRWLLPGADVVGH